MKQEDDNKEGKMSDQADTPSQPSRRTLLKSALGAGATAAGAGMLAGLSPPADAGLLSNWFSNIIQGNFRIDVHCHHIPDFYRASLASYGITTAGGIDLPDWSPELAINFMNNYGIKAQVLSISEPGVYYLPSASLRQDMAYQLNNYTSMDLIHSTNSSYSGRFGGFAVLPIGDPNDSEDIYNARAEAVRALGTLKMDGIGLYSNYNGTYLGDPAFDPLMETLNDMGAMVFLHPVTPSDMPDLGLPTFLYEFPFDTTRAVVNMCYKNVLLRYPNIRWLLAHAGGTVPFLAYRTSLLRYYSAIAQNLGIESLDDGGLAYSRLFYDTALSPAPSAMKSVREVTSVSHVMFATDWPFSGPVFTIPGDPAPQLEDSFSGTELQQVLRDNALNQFPRLKARVTA